MNDEEQLNRLIDGELGPEEQAQMQARVASDSTLQTKLAEMKRADALVREAFEAPMAEETPDRFLKAIDAGLAAKAPSLQSPPLTNVVTLPHTAENDNDKSWWKASGAMAASLAIGLFLGTQWPTAGGEGSTSQALASALSSTPSAQSVALAKGESITPQLSFAKAGGGFCRQFLLSGKAGAKAGLACTHSGEWSIEALSPTNTSASAQDGYVVAEGQDTAGIDAVVTRLRAGDPLDKAAEADLIASGWK
jgi:hypothetical protein